MSVILIMFSIGFLAGWCWKQITNWGKENGTNDRK